MTEYDELRKELEEAEKNIAAIRARLDVVKEDEWPKVGDEYWFNSVDGVVCGDWTDHRIDINHKYANNCYHTPEEARSKAKWLADPRTEARFRLEQLDGFDVNGRYAVHCHNGLLYIVEITARTDGIRFTTKAQAEYAIDYHATDLMLVLTDNAK